MSNEIRIYVACLAAYNNGVLHGAWIDATQSLNDIQDAVNTMLTSSPVSGAEEYAIHDYEGFEGYKISEYQGLKSAHDIACFIEEYGAVGAAILDHACDDIQDAKNQRSGEYVSLADFAQQFTEETTDIPEQLKYYIDYERMGRDMELSGDIFTIETGFEQVHVFWSN